MGTYSHKQFACPYYKADRRKGDLFVLSCEPGILRLPGRKLFNEYTEKHCCSSEGWMQCTAARALSRYYQMGGET